MVRPIGANDGATTAIGVDECGRASRLVVRPIGTNDEIASRTIGANEEWLDQWTSECISRR